MCYLWLQTTKRFWPVSQNVKNCLWLSRVSHVFYHCIKLKLFKLFFFFKYLDFKGRGLKLILTKPMRKDSSSVLQGSDMLPVMKCEKKNGNMWCKYCHLPVFGLSALCGSKRLLLIRLLAHCVSIPYCDPVKWCHKYTLIPTNANSSVFWQVVLQKLN